MADQSALGPSARHIAREYARARARGVTQRQFVAATGISSPRYLRKILAGERSGRVIEQRAANGGAFSIPVTYKGKREATIQVRLPAGTSRLDVYRPSVQKRIRSNVSAARREERLRAPSPTKLTEYEKARLRGKVEYGKIRQAKKVGAHIIPVLRRSRA